MTLQAKDATGATQDLATADVGGELATQHVLIPATSVMVDGEDTVVPKFAAIAAASSGDNTLVAAVTAKKIRVLSAYLIAAGTVSVKFQTAAAGAYLSGALPLVANGGFVLPFSPMGWFQTVAGDLLNLELSGAVAVGGGLTYIEVD